MKELIYNIREIFDDVTQNGCLFQYETDYYHIPAYQRGYKWESNDNGAVTVLLSDLWKAFLSFQKKERSEYFLQYITLKKNKNSLEVIDGQQRLTTLSILVSVIALRLETKNIADSKLDYAIRENFFNRHIYPFQELRELLKKDWKDNFHNTEFDTQDIFYITKATKKCYSFLDSKSDEEIQDFSDYLLSYVKIIVNSVESYTPSETVFQNLNSHKVPLTEAELIKGLLITKVGRNNRLSQSKHFREIMEIRMNIGRKWDEMANWANKPEIKSFYFNNKKDSMHGLLKLTGLTLGYNDSLHKFSENKKDFPLFNFFHDHNQFSRIFEKLENVKNRLDKWYWEADVYNLLGYCRFAEGSSRNNLSFLNSLLEKETYPSVKSKLFEIRDELLEGIVLEKLNYLEDAHQIHRVLLALNVFIKGQENIRFNFYSFKEEKWSLEHIFPRTPEGKDNQLGKTEIETIIYYLGESSTDEIRDILGKGDRTPEEKTIYQSVLKNCKLMNGIGNMCLLSTKDNSSNGNLLFSEKRENILRRIQSGSFVPKHTFDVFGKMYNNPDLNLQSWTKHDDIAHKSHIQSNLSL